MQNSTIAAISTAQGLGGIGVIRISGEKAIEIADKIFKAVSNKKLSDAKGYTAHFGHVFFEGEKLDECIATVFNAPHSYTGEDVVELSCHGGIYITKQVLRAAFDNGAVCAQAGEFTKRAFLNGKLDLTQAESVMDIIGAKSGAAAKSALSVHEGALSKNINAVKDDLVLRAAHLCAWADYPEEDIEEIEFEALKKALSEGAHKLQNLIKNYDKGKAIRQGIDTVIVGKPNVGKSTLMNLITGYEKSIVTQIAGTTRDIVEETAIVRDITLHLSDTAGIHDTDNTIEKIGVDKAKNRLGTAELVIAVFDSSKALDDDDFALLNSIKDSTCIAVINKDDLVQKIDVEKIKEVTEHIVYMSAKDSKGLTEFEDAVENIAGTADFDPSSAVLSNERQRSLAKFAYDSLIEAISALEFGMTYDAVTVALEEAISHLCELTGERVTETVVDNVFHQFCVGK
ncbi:MAG: tRNA uridine-5-carboxymethylaminomethyl(34) synthesis GTPase MnmE [Ruminococcaceae bacterium]|nr:tRNA uridine-5-carboxymethylaminomethyl(34) synthesis GTPase MnmE [Oscillospiraceae bacterium]